MKLTKIKKNVFVGVFSVAVTMQTGAIQRKTANIGGCCRSSARTCRQVLVRETFALSKLTQLCGVDFETPNTNGCLLAQLGALVRNFDDSDHLLGGAILAHSPQSEARFEHSLTARSEQFLSPRFIEPTTYVARKP